MKFNAEYVSDILCKPTWGSEEPYVFKDLSVSLLCEKAWSASKVNPLDPSSSEEEVEF